MVAVDVEAELRPTVVEADLALGPVAMFVVESDAVVEEPRGVVAGILAEPVEPMEVVLGLFAEVVVPMVVDAESPFVMAVAMGLGDAAALIPEIDPKLVAIAADLAAHASVPRVAELVLETVVALEAGSSMAELGSGPVLALEAEPGMAEFEGSKYL